MFYKTIIFILLTFFSVSILFAQKGVGKSYRIDRYSSVYLPLGKISFADSIVEFKVGTPPPLAKYGDTSQCLHEPNYKNYHTNTFLSLGCKGSITLAFTDNGFMNLPGYDLYIFEVGPSKESAKIEISENNIDWIYAGEISGGKSNIDLSEASISRDIVYYYVRITDLQDVCRSKSAGADIDAVGAINSVIKLSINADVLFNVSEFDLKESASKTLDNIVLQIKQVEKATILVEGHTDSDGDEEFNLELSEKRCNTVIEKLKSLFGENAMYDYESISHGEIKPKVPNDSQLNKQLNRRVEITVLPPKDYYESLLNKN
jgi:OOP family OmpA-OmpF porin